MPQGWLFKTTYRLEKTQRQFAVWFLSHSLDSMLCFDIFSDPWHYLHCVLARSFVIICHTERRWPQINVLLCQRRALRLSICWVVAKQDISGQNDERPLQVKYVRKPWRTRWERNGNKLKTLQIWDFLLNYCALNTTIKFSEKFVLYIPFFLFIFCSSRCVNHPGRSKLEV